MKYKVIIDKPTIDGCLYKGTTITIDDSDKRYNGKLRGKDETGGIWYLDENEIELIQGE
jgi:hypothetical protein